MPQKICKCYQNVNCTQTTKRLQKVNTKMDCSYCCTAAIATTATTKCCCCWYYSTNIHSHQSINSPSWCAQNIHNAAISQTVLGTGACSGCISSDA